MRHPIADTRASPPCPASQAADGDGAAPPAGAAAICRGARRWLLSRGLASLTEVTLANGRRADILALSADGAPVIVEVKSCAADYRSDSKWPDYLEFATAFWFAVDAAFPLPLLPPDGVGVLVCDGYGAAVLREAPMRSLHASRRKAVALAFGRLAALRLHGLEDPWSRALTP